MARVWSSKSWFLRCLCVWGKRHPWFAAGRRGEHPSCHGYAQDEVCPTLNGLGMRTPASSISPRGEGTATAASSTLVTPAARLSSRPRWEIAELLAALLPSLFVSALWAHRIFVIIQSMCPVHTNQFKVIYWKSGLMQGYLEVAYSKDVFFSLSLVYFLLLFLGEGGNWILQEVMTFACKSLHLNFDIMQ